MTDLSTFKLVTKADAAAIFAVCTKSIDNYIKQGLLPAPVQFMSKEYWHPEEFTAFLDGLFKRSTEVEPAKVETAKLDLVNSSDAGCITQKKMHRFRTASVDSSATSRQMARQTEKLKILNG